MWIKKNNPALDATKVPTAIDIAWAAGFWEGEGSCRRTKTRGISITAVQKDSESLYRLREFFGGNVRFARCATIPPEQQCHVWECCGDRARLFMAVIYSFLTARRKAQIDATRALEFLNGLSPAGLSMEQLKDRLISFNEQEKAKKWDSPEFRKTETYRKYNREQMRKYRSTKSENCKVVPITERKAV